MIVDVVGKMKVDFQSDDGRRISGTNIFYLEPIVSQYGVGSKAVKRFIPDTVLSYEFLSVGKIDFNVTFDGKILGLNK